MRILFSHCYIIKNLYIFKNSFRSLFQHMFFLVGLAENILHFYGLDCY
jgi:hypothetical protein